MVRYTRSFEQVNYFLFYKEKAKKLSVFFTKCRIPSYPQIRVALSMSQLNQSGSCEDFCNVTGLWSMSCSSSTAELKCYRKGQKKQILHSVEKKRLFGSLKSYAQSINCSVCVENNRNCCLLQGLRKRLKGFYNFIGCQFERSVIMKHKQIFPSIT